MFQIDKQTYEQTLQMLATECDCRPGQPDGRQYCMCIPCKTRQDVARRAANSKDAVKVLADLTQGLLHDEDEMLFHLALNQIELANLILEGISK